MLLKNLPKGFTCIACGDPLTKKNWSVYDDIVKTRCRGCQSDLIRVNRYKKIAKSTYSHVKYLQDIDIGYRPRSFITMVRNGKISEERLAHILREVDFGRDVKDKVWTTLEEGV